jgi:Terminase large subunit, T4likevirus-type, N-terminal
MLMAKDLMRAFDPTLLMRDAGIEPDPWQAKLLTERPKRALLLCSRQSGKTETAITLGEWTALYEPGSLTLIVSPSQRQSGEVFRRLMILHGKLKEVPGLVAESALRAEYSNGSRVIALPGSERTTRGYAGAKLIIVDEASRCDDALFAALRPSMATVDGSLIMLTTPFGKRGEFYRAWTEGEGWTRIRVPASMCPRLTKAFLDEERHELGPMRFSEEYELAFLEPDETVFMTALIDRAFTTEVHPLWQ